MKPLLPSIRTSSTHYRLAVVFLLGLVIVSCLIGLTACSQPSRRSDAVGVVERYLQAKKSNDYSTWKAAFWAAQKEPQQFTPSFEKPGDLGVLSLSIGKVELSKDETKRIREMYSGSDLAKSHAWSDDFIAENLIAVSASYSVDYDNTKVPYAEGNLTQYFYLVRDDPGSAWLIWDASSPAS